MGEQITHAPISVIYICSSEMLFPVSGSIQCTFRVGYYTIHREFDKDTAVLVVPDESSSVHNRVCRVLIAMLNKRNRRGRARGGNNFSKTDSSTVWVLTNTCLVSKVASAVLHGKQKYLGPLAAESRCYNKPASAENIWGTFDLPTITNIT